MDDESLYDRTGNIKDVNTVLVPLSELREMQAEIVRLRDLAGTCYAGLGAECDLPERWLDVLSAAAHGEPFDTEDLLPYTASVQPTKPFTEEEKAALRKWATEGDERDTLERADAIRARGQEE